MQVIKGCFKFVESDIFVYVDKIDKIYLIYVDQLAFIREVTEEASSEGVNKSVNSSIPGKLNSSGEEGSRNTIRS